MSTHAGRLAILGAGVMGEALLSGLLRSGRLPSSVCITERREDRAAELRKKHGVEVLSNVDATKTSSVIVIVVKPQDMSALLDEISSFVQPGTLVVSLAAGITTSFLESRLPAGTAVVRVMPNTPALVDEGMAALSAGSHCSAELLDHAVELLKSVGKALVVPEKYQDAVTAISGSGPAYVFYVVEAMIEAGVVLGLPRSVAHDLVVQTVVGASVLLRETGEHPTVLRENVTSPAGTTAAALRELDDHKVRAAFITAMEAARDRSKELAEGH